MGFAVALRGVGRRVPREVIGWPHRIQRIGCGQNRVWSYVPKKNPQGFGSYPKVLDGLPQRGAARPHLADGEASRREPGPPLYSTETGPQRG
jgi:hypothetical protein